jgi:hypothetical protein
MSPGNNAPRPPWSRWSNRAPAGRTLRVAGGLSTVLVLLLVLFRPGRVAVVIVGLVCVMSVYLLMHGRADWLWQKKGMRK